MALGEILFYLISKLFILYTSAKFVILHLLHLARAMNWLSWSILLACLSALIYSQWVIVINCPANSLQVTHKTWATWLIDIKVNSFLKFMHALLRLCTKLTDLRKKTIALAFGLLHFNNIFSSTWALWLQTDRACHEIVHILILYIVSSEAKGSNWLLS